MDKNYLYEIINNRLNTLSEEKIKEIFNKIFENNSAITDALDEVFDGILICKNKNKIIYKNDAFLKLFKLSQKIKSIEEIFKLTKLDIFNKNNIDINYTFSKTILYKKKRINVVISPGKNDILTYYFIDKTIFHNLQMRLINHYISLQKIIEILHKEINNSLNNINIISELARINNLEKSDIKDLKKEVNKIDHILNKFYDSFVGPTLTFEKVNVEEMIEKLIKSLIYSNEDKNISYSLEKKTDNTVILANRTSLRKIFLSIFKNSISYIDNEGKITIKLLKNSNQLIIEIYDNGKDLNYKDLYEISNPFYSTHSDNPHFDLSIASNLIYKHLGDIEIEKTKEYNRKIKISLPMRTEKQKSLPDVDNL